MSYLLWLLLTVAACALAYHKGRSVVPWLMLNLALVAGSFFLLRPFVDLEQTACAGSMLLGSLLTLVVVALLPAKTAKHQSADVLLDG